MTEALRSVATPFRDRLRRKMADHYGRRPVNNWGDGDLPAPFAEGDLLYLPEMGANDRLRGMGPGYFVLCSAYSIDEGDAWYFRVYNGLTNARSDRLHVAYADRASDHWTEDCDWMKGFRLVDTADPEGLALREATIAAGWQFAETPKCPTCGSYQFTHH